MSAKIITRGSVPHRIWQLVGYGIVAVGVLWVIYMAPSYMVTHFSLALTYGLAILGLNLVTGYSGQVSLGHSAFFGLGAYTSMYLMNDNGWSFWLTLPATAVMGFAVGFLMGIPALRVKGLYLSLITLAVAIAFPAIVKKLDGITGGDNGKTLEVEWTPPKWIPGDLSSSDWRFITVLGITIVMFALASNLIRSRVGRGLVALRDNETGAAVSGVYPAGFKTMAFAVSAVYAGVAGACYSLVATTLAPNVFSVQLSISFIAGLVVAGVATIAGGILGGGIVEFLPYYTSNWLEGPRANILFGLILIAAIFVMPGGIVWGIRQLRAKFVLFIPKLPRLSSSRASENIAEEHAPVS
ncbi:MAG TPA: branched-chain amino acid ABC transporter permease [Acidimicrobiales bacterium]